MGAPNYSKPGLLEFLKQSAIAGLLNPATARSRRQAAEQLLTQINDPEAEDLRCLDVDELCARFHKLQESTIRPESLRLYNARLKAALSDYFAWVEDPDGFVPSGGETRQLRKRMEAGHTDKSLEEQALEAIKLSAPQQPADLIPIPIRPDRVVYVQNLPLNLRPEEADKIARVVKALATGDDESP